MRTSKKPCYFCDTRVNINWRPMWDGPKRLEIPLCDHHRVKYNNLPPHVFEEDVRALHQA